ncbi:MAG: insulinase family protein [bacterium]|nr:insulinase family protein [bacterium]
MKYSIRNVFLGLFISSLAGISFANEFDGLKPDGEVAGFRPVAVYENANDAPMGARFQSVRHGFIIDLLRIESVPQGFFWVKSPPKWDKGEPHTCEHLLLGKGNRGKAVAALEDMALGSSSAYTEQLYTAYHFNTVAGTETYYKLFEEKLMALLHPDFTDEEVRREVCHVGVVIDPKTGKRSLEEKGTVYTEMVSGYEKPWSYLWNVMDDIVYGDTHPVANVSGGEPAAIRTMTPQDMREFHREFYHLSNMGIIVALPENIPLQDALRKFSEILDRCQTGTDSSPHPGMSGFDLPPPQPMLPEGSIKIVDYPSDNPQDQCDMLLSWPAQLTYTAQDELLLNLFLGAFASGSTSNLYALLIDSKTQSLDLEATSVYGSSSRYLGHPIRINVGGMPPSSVTDAKIRATRSAIIKELQKVADLPDNSPEVKKFNEQALSLLTSTKKYYEDILNKPPMFGFRGGPGGTWQHNLNWLEHEPGFRKSLVWKKQIAFADSLLRTGKNVWKGYIQNWKLLSTQPFVVANQPSPAVMQKMIDDKSYRIAGYIEQYKTKYNVKTAEEAILAYEKEFDSNTKQLETTYAQQAMPKFIENPPLTLDDPLRFDSMKLQNGSPLVASTFENMTSATIGVAFNLKAIPESLLVYVPFLPSLITDIGVYENGKPVTHKEMNTRLRSEVLNYYADFDHGVVTGRSEFIVRAAGANHNEMINGLQWMTNSLYSPYLALENLSRIQDVIDQILSYYRSTMKGGEEGWVDMPADAYRFQTDPVYLATDCFLTKTHLMQRLRWQLTTAGSSAEQKVINEFLAKLAKTGATKPRSDLIKWVNEQPIPEQSDVTKTVCKRIVAELLATLSEIPDANLAQDWKYLCSEIEADLAVTPTVAMNRMKATLTLLTHSDNTRFYLISNSGERAAIMPTLESFAKKLSSEKTSVQNFATIRRIDQRLASRHSGMMTPVYVGLVNDNTRSGVLLFSAKNAEPYDVTSEKMLDALAGNLYSGGAGHGLFMRTWGAGLAYSNGYRYRDHAGRCNYYAERCPDVAETMRFVVSVLKEAKYDESLGEYAIALAFEKSRAGSNYEERGEAIASDLADGFPPERIAAYRKKVLGMRNTPDLTKKLFARMEKVYGKVLIGYGESAEQVEQGNFFLIGPERQFASLETEIAISDTPQPVYRLYPRDFWLTK